MKGRVEVERKSNEMPTETMQCECNVCRKGMHIEEARYCTRCGTKLNLEQAISKKDHLHFH